MWDSDDYTLYSKYDVDQIKPAILFGDRVNLVTFRETMREMINNRGSTLWRMPMFRVMAYLRLAATRDSAEIEFLGVDPKELPTVEEAKAVLGESDPRSALFEDFWDRYEVRIDTFVERAVEIWRKRFTELMAPELEDAASSGILTVEGWLTLPKEMRGTPIPEDQVFDASVEVFLDRLATTSNQPLLDVGADWVVKNWPMKTASTAEPQTSNWRGPTIVAANAIMRLPGLEQLSLSEVIDIRGELADYLPAFRSEMVRLGEDLAESSDKNSDGLAAEVDRRWHRDIAPVLEEIRRDVATAAYPRRLLNTITAQKDAMVSMGGAVVLGTGSVAAGISTLVPAALAAAYPLARALNDAVTARSSIRKNRLYLLYALEKNIQRRLR